MGFFDMLFGGSKKASKLASSSKSSGGAKRSASKATSKKKAPSKKSTGQQSSKSAQSNKTTKWNRAHEFARKKSTKRQVGHPVYVYGKRKNLRKYLTFTHTPEAGKEDAYEKLKHNIDPEDERDCYVKKQYSFSNENSLQAPDKKYRIHEEDKETIKQLKK